MGNTCCCNTEDKNPESTSTLMYKPKLESRKFTSHNYEYYDNRQEQDEIDNQIEQLSLQEDQ